MKLKYYLRGMGVGILFATIILSVSYRVSSKAQLSDNEIIKRAEELGMVKESDIKLDDIINPSVTPTVEPTTKPSPSPTVQSTDTPAAAPTEKPSVTKEVKPAGSTGTESTKVPDKSSLNNENTSDVIPETNNIMKQNDISFRIIPGMTSEDVSNLLKDKGIIEDAKAFNQYLKINNYTTDINIGEYEIEKFSSYEDIADAIITK